MSRIAFAREYGADSTNPRYAWSYVNHEERLVLFGAWGHLEKHGQQLIFSTSWRRNPKGRKNNSFMPSLRHIEHIIEDGYSLRTFRQYGVPKSNGAAIGIEKFDKKIEEKELAILGDDFFAVDVGHEPASGDDRSKIDQSNFLEGRKFDVVQTHYERNRAARSECLRIFGLSCQVCEFNFDKVFGEVAKEFIHVHHLVPVSQRKAQYRVDPENDLVPVCPNCHAMLHKRQPPYSISELKTIISEKKKL